MSEIDLIKKEVEEIRDKSKNKYFYDGGKHLANAKPAEGEISDKIVSVQKVTKSGFVSLRDKDTQTHLKGVDVYGVNLSCRLIHSHDNTPLDREFHEMVESGHLETIKLLREENS